MQSPIATRSGSPRRGALLALLLTLIVLLLLVLLADTLTFGALNPTRALRSRAKRSLMEEVLVVDRDSSSLSTGSEGNVIADATVVLRHSNLLGGPNQTGSRNTAAPNGLGSSEREAGAGAVSKVHVHLHTIGDSLTAGMFRNLLQSKTYRTMSRFFPYGPYVASGLALDGRRFPHGPSRIVSYSSSVYAHPGARTDEVMQKFLNASRTLMEEYVRKGSGVRNPVVNEIWDVLVHRLPPGGNVTVLLGPEVTAAPFFRPRPPQVYTAARGVKKVIHFGPPPPPVQVIDHLVVICMVLSGTNDALHAPDRFVNITLPDDVPAEVALQHIHELHAACRNSILSGIRMYERRRDDAERRDSSARRRNTSWRPDVYLLEEVNGEDTLVLPTLKVTVLNVPILLPPMLIRNDSSIMKDLLLPRRHREDSNRLYGRLCLMWNHSAEAVLRSHRYINTQLSDFSSTANYLTSAAARISKSEIPGYVTLLVAKKPIVVEDALLSEAPSEVVRTQGGYFSDCIHPSLAGYQAMVKAIQQQLISELLKFL